MSKSADTEPNFPNIPPDREALLDELARCFVQAAVTRLLQELHQVSDGLPDKSLSIGHPKKTSETRSSSYCTAAAPTSSRREKSTRRRWWTRRRQVAEHAVARLSSDLRVHLRETPSSERRARRHEPGGGPCSTECNLRTFAHKCSKDSQDAW
jgi:hypothetical protein